jgi:hypothetical protein
MFFLKQTSRGLTGKAHPYLLTAATILFGSAVCHTTLFVAPALSNSAEGRLLISPSQSLPSSVLTAVKRSLANKLNKPESSLSIQLVSASKKTWPDGCLGLRQPGAICTQVLVPGWLVKVSTSGKIYTYRTNADGRLVVFEKVEVASNPQEALPPSVRDAVIREVNRGLGGGLQFLIYSISGSRQVWPDGCLGLGSGGICSTALVSGWRVEVETFSNIRIYRTNANGSLVKLEGTKPRPLPTCLPNKRCL